MRIRINDEQRDISYGELVALQQEFEAQLDENGVVFDDDESYEEALGDFIQQYIDGNDNPTLDLSDTNLRPIRDSKCRRVRDGRREIDACKGGSISDLCRINDSILDHFSPYIEECKPIVSGVDRCFQVTDAEDDDFIALMNAYVYSDNVEYEWETNSYIVDRTLGFEVPYWNRTKQLMKNQGLYEMVVDAIESEYGLSNDIVKENTGYSVWKENTMLEGFGTEDEAIEYAKQISLENEDIVYSLYEDTFFNDSKGNEIDYYKELIGQYENGDEV